MRRWLQVLPLTLVASTAWALPPGEHRSLAEKACKQTSLPTAFCRHVGQDVYATDAREWEDLSAHAQRALGQDRCEAADLAIVRVDALARTVVDRARAREFEDAAKALGRALHTLQDECAHHGMTNEEHAYYSLMQTCTGEDVSPDVQPAAVACATARTNEVMAAVADALQGVSWTGVDRICLDSDDRDTCALAPLPSPRQGCRFLRLHDDWDGADSSWNGDVVGPLLVAAFEDGLAGRPQARSACAGDAAAIDPTTPHAPVVELKAGCTKADILCLGKVDEDEGAPGVGDEDVAAGCQAGRDVSVFVGLALAALVPRRRRRARS